MRDILTFREGVAWFNQQQIPAQQRLVVSNKKVLVSGILTRDMFNKWSDAIGQSGCVDVPEIEYSNDMILERVTIVSKMNDVIQYYLLFNKE